MEFRLEESREFNLNITMTLAMQRNIEETLKKTVRSNYNLFLNAHQEIHTIGMEVLDLKKLVDGTQDLIQVNELSLYLCICGVCKF